MTGLQKTLALLKKHEGFSDTVYLDGKGIPTIGYGFTDPGLIKKGKITRKEADAILTKRIASEYKALHDTLPNFDKLSDDSKSALISYRFNYPAGFKDTTKFMNYWRAGLYDKAIKEVNAGMNDAANSGLRTRRLEEQALLSSDPFLTGIKTTDGDFGKKMVFPIEKQPEYEPEWKLQRSTKTVYPLNNTVPESISSWSGADAPNATPRLKDFQEATRDDAYQQWLNQGIDISTRRSPFKLSLSLPSLDSMMQIESPQRLMENYFAEVLGINNMIPSMPSLFPRFKNGKLPEFKDGLQPNIFRRPDGTYFFQQDDQQIDVFPLMQSLGDDPAAWSYTDSSGRIYTPNRSSNTSLGEIIQDDRNAGSRFWNNYIGELQYNLANDRVVGGKYTLPAIGLGALGMYGAGAAGASAMPATIQEAAGLVGKNIYGTAARNFALSMLGGEALNEGSRLATGNSWGLNVSNATGGYMPELAADFTNPGYLLSGESGMALKDAFNNFSRQFLRYASSVLKQIMAPSRMQNLADRMKAYYSQDAANTKTELDNVNNLRNNILNEWLDVRTRYDSGVARSMNDIRATIAGKVEEQYDGAEDMIKNLLLRSKLNDKVEQVMSSKGIRKDKVKTSVAARRLELLMDDEYEILPDFSKMSAKDIVRFVNTNADKFRFNKGGDRALLRLDTATEDAEGLKNILAYSGFRVTPDGMLEETSNVIPFDQIFKTGDFSVPIFGTNNEVIGTINVTNPGTRQLTNYIDLIKSVSDKKINPRKVVFDNTGYSASVPQAYQNALKQNIDYLTNRFPGSKAFGSSTTSAYAGTPHSTHDIDLLISDTDFINSAEKEFGSRTSNGWRVSSKPNGSGYEDTYTHSLGSQYGDAGDIDFNIIYTDPNTGMASSTMGTRALELYRQFFPSEYKLAVMESMRTGQPIAINKTPKELIDAYDPVVKTITDSFSSSKPKHVPRAEAHLTTTDPDYVEKALDLYAQEKLGGAALHLPLTRLMFNDVELNRRIFKELGYKGVDEETVVNNPAKMKNLVDYWYIHNSVFGRGVSSGRLQTAGLSQDLALDNAFRQWTGYGGNVNGAGLNTVTLGDSGYGDVYGYILPRLNFENGLTAEQLIQSAKRQLGYYQYQFTDQEKKAILEIVEKRGLHIDMSAINNPANLLDNLSSYTGNSKDVLQEISDKLGIRALSRSTLFGGGRYNSMTGDVASTDALMYAPRNQQEMPVSDINRDRATVSDNNAGSGELLKDAVSNIASTRSRKVKLQLAEQNQLYRKILSGRIGSGKKYEEMTNADIERLAKRRVRRLDPKLSDRDATLEKEYNEANEKSNRLSDRIITSSSRVNKATRLANRSKYILDDRTDAMLKLGASLGGVITIGGGIGYLVNRDRKHRAFAKSKEYQDFLNSSAAASDNPDSIEAEYDRQYEKYMQRIVKQRSLRSDRRPNKGNSKVALSARLKTK